MNLSRVIAGILLLVFVIAMGLFFSRNAGDHIVTIDLLYWKVYDIDFIWPVFVAFMIGVILTLLYCLYYFIGFGLRIRRLKKDNKSLEKELLALRNLPLDDSLDDLRADAGKEVPQ
jgi:hypothetical protein